jgi:hypothetical protein
VPFYGWLILMLPVFVSFKKTCKNCNITPTLLSSKFSASLRTLYSVPFRERTSPIARFASNRLL